MLRRLFKSARGAVRPGVLVTGGVAASAVVVVIAATVGGGPAPAGSANLWVDTNGGTCTWQGTAAAYSDAAACSSTSAAYTAANSNSPSNGATVGIRAGSYSDQLIPLSTRTGGDIAFVTSGGAVTLTGLSVLGDKVSFTSVDGLFTVTGGIDIFGGDNNGDITSVSSGERTKGVTFDGIKAMGNVNGTSCTTSCGGRAFYISNAQDLVIRNSDIGYGKATVGNGSAKAVDTPVNPGSGLTVDNVTFDSNFVHDWSRDVSGDPHTECMFLMSIQTWTISNNRFSNCSVYSISLGRLSGDPDPANVTIENNTFEPSDNFGVGDEQGFFAMVLDHVSTRYGTLRIRNNSFAQAIQVETADVPDSTGFDQTIIESNIIHGQSSCSLASTSPTYRFNVLDSGNCGTGATLVADVRTGWTTTSGTWDFHLKSGASAIGAASSTSGQFTATDIGGHVRDGDPDAGAYEFGSGS